MCGMKVRVAHPQVGVVEADVGDVALIIGRQGPDADIVVGAGRVSRRHGRLWRDSDELWYEDLGSANGSWVEGVRLSGPVPVHSAIVIVIGESTLTRVDDSMSVLMRAPAGGES